MEITHNRRQIIYFGGDLFFLFLALGITLFLRHLSWPSWERWQEHFIPFSILFGVWLFVFYVAGLYEKETLIFQKKFPLLLFQVQVVNIIIAVFFFYLFPIFQLTPKTILFIYLLVSFVLILSWRLTMSKKIKPLGPEKEILIIGEGADLEELILELNENPLYNLKVKRSAILEAKEVATVIADLRSEKAKKIIPNLYELLLSGVSVIDAEKLFEDVFERIPLSFLEKQWFLENISSAHHSTYDLTKRMIDIAFSLLIGAFSLILYPFVILAIKIEDGSPFFIIQERVGQGGKIIKILKFRSMKVNDPGVWVKEKDERITVVGQILRKTRIDELPQLYNVLKGDLSLIGPRPDMIALKEELEKEIPYYNIRGVVKPGLSGWAQVNQDSPPQSIQETKKRLMYDLYYLKNRSLILDLKILLRTLSILASRSGK